MNFLQTMSEETASLAANDLRFILTLAAIWMILGLLGWFRPHSIRYVARVLFPIGALVCVGVAALAGIFLATGHAPEVLVLPLGLPDLPFHLRLDALSRQSEDALLLEEGTLYPALWRLESKGLLEAEWGLSENKRKAKYYRLTGQGRRQLRHEVKTWEAYAAAVAKVLSATQPPLAEEAR